MLKYISILPLVLLAGCSITDPYAKVGIGKKIAEYQIVDPQRGRLDDPFTARFEAGYKCFTGLSENLRCGVAHHSQWFSGIPFNTGVREYHKTELFIDYVWE